MSFNELDASANFPEHKVFLKDATGVLEYMRTSVLFQLLEFFVESG